jgi:hypothetical protein
MCAYFEIKNVRALAGRTHRWHGRHLHKCGLPHAFGQGNGRVAENSVVLNN